VAVAQLEERGLAAGLHTQRKGDGPNLKTRGKKEEKRENREKKNRKQSQERERRKGRSLLTSVLSAPLASLHRRIDAGRSSGAEL
jgi:hypothetical protein